MGRRHVAKNIPLEGPAIYLLKIKTKLTLFWGIASGDISTIRTPCPPPIRMAPKKKGKGKGKAKGKTSGGKSGGGGAEVVDPCAEEVAVNEAAADAEAEKQEVVEHTSAAATSGSAAEADAADAAATADTADTAEDAAEAGTHATATAAEAAASPTKTSEGEKGKGKGKGKKGTSSDEGHRCFHCQSEDATSACSQCQQAWYCTVGGWVGAFRFHRRSSPPHHHPHPPPPKCSGLAKRSIGSGTRRPASRRWLPARSTRRNGAT